MKDCGKITDLLSLYIDDQLTPRQRAQVDQHLAGCADCSRELAELRAAVEAVGALPQQELPDGFSEGLRAHLLQAQAEQTASRSAAPATARPGVVSTGWFTRMRRSAQRPVWRGALATAATVLLVFAVVNQALPGWDGNVWSLKRTPQLTDVGSSEAPPGQGDRGAIKTPAPEPAPSAPGVSSDSSDASRAPGGVISTETGSWALSSDGSMIIRTASLTVQVEDFLTAERRVAPAIEAAGGYIEGSSVSLDGKVRSGWWRVRVPQAKFSETLTKLEELGKLTYKELGSEDVSGAIIDLEARISNLRRQELRLGELISQAKTLDEILRVENELNRIRYQIESAEGQLKWYRERVAMSTIYLHMTEPGATPLPPVPGADLWERLYQAFLATWRGIFKFMESFVVFIASVTPVIALLAAAWWGYGRYRKSRTGR